MGTATQGRRILLVEDDEDIRQEIEELFREDGFDVLGLRNGREALDALRHGTNPDLILLDLRTPIMDGWEFRVEQKRDPSLAAIPVVAISADGSPKAAAIDADRFVEKPFTADQLRSAVGEVLHHQEVERAQRAVEQADRMASLGLLAGSIAHEINNPLACVAGNLEFVAAELRRLSGELPPGRLGDLEHVVAEAREAGDRVRRAVRDLATFSRLDRDRREVLELRILVDMAAGVAGAEVRHRGKLVVDHGPVPRIEADAARLGHVLVNLLVTAAHALDEERAPTNEVHVVTGTDADGAAVIEVHDTGRGHDPDEVGRLFDPFYTDRAGAPTGLRLSVCKGVVESLGGTIDVASVPGTGTTFRVRLPAAPASSPQAGGGQAAPEGTIRGRILVVDDEPMVLASFRRILAREHDVTSVGSAEEALRLLDAGASFDVILCDLMMPGTSGMDLYERLRGKAPDQAERMVFMTGGAFTARARSFLDQVKNPWFEKPFDVSKLMGLVEHRVRASRGWRQQLSDRLARLGQQYGVPF
ncbi:MAG: response regulator [Planctomycetes bacterium]|nr:response regulator [Planctomycetota bacterium]